MTEPVCPPSKAQLRRAWRDGIASGNAGVLDFAELRREAFRLHKAMQPKGEAGKKP